jgi:hypothetical protein
MADLGDSATEQDECHDGQGWSNIKKYILYAPLGKKRHNRELQLSSAVNVGTLPSWAQKVCCCLFALDAVIWRRYAWLIWATRPQNKIVAESPRSAMHIYAKSLRLAQTSNSRPSGPRNSQHEV